jgi:hypothetical protein
MKLVMYIGYSIASTMLFVFGFLSAIKGDLSEAISLFTFGAVIGVQLEVSDIKDRLDALIEEDE